MNLINNSIPTAPTNISLMDGHLTKTRGGKKGQIRPYDPVLCCFSGTGDDRNRRLQKPARPRSSILTSLKTWKKLSASASRGTR